jgi:multidrug efflux pump subunit AcrA (membrane-fusion protein)
MIHSQYLKPALAAVFCVVLGGGWYWFEHRPRSEDKETPAKALVVVTKATNACFSDMVRGTGYIVPRREAVVGVEQDGARVSDVLVREGEMVTENQELAKLTLPSAVPGQRSPAGPTSLRAPAAGLVTEVRTVAGAPA